MEYFLYMIYRFLNFIVMKKYLFLLLFLLPFVTLGAQTVTVLDADDGKPVADVAVYNESRSQFGYTNHAGKVSLKGFPAGKPVFFQHFSYERVSYTPDEIREAGWVIQIGRAHV